MRFIRPIRNLYYSRYWLRKATCALIGHNRIPDCDRFYCVRCWRFVSRRR